jgi:hypothetical protein
VQAQQEAADGGKVAAQSHPTATDEAGADAEARIARLTHCRTVLPEPWPGSDLSRIVAAPALWRSVHPGLQMCDPGAAPPAYAEGPGSAVALLPDPATALPFLLRADLCLPHGARDLSAPAVSELRRLRLCS